MLNLGFADTFVAAVGDDVVVAAAVVAAVAGKPHRDQHRHREGVTRHCHRSKDVATFLNNFSFLKLEILESFY